MKMVSFNTFIAIAHDVAVISGKLIVQAIYAALSSTFDNVSLSYHQHQIYF